jgi:hypothetical protein
MDENMDETNVAREEIWLLSQPPLWKYLDFVEDIVIDGAMANFAALGSGARPTIIITSSRNARQASLTRWSAATWIRQWPL